MRGVSSGYLFKAAYQSRYTPNGGFKPKHGFLNPVEQMVLNSYLTKIKQRLSPSSVEDNTPKHSQLGASGNMHSSNARHSSRLSLDNPNARYKLPEEGSKTT